MLVPSSPAGRYQRPRSASIETITGKDAMSNHIGNCLPHYAQMLGCGARGGVLLVAPPELTFSLTPVVMKEIICVCDPAEMDWFKASLAAWQPERMVCTPDHCP